MKKSENYKIIMKEVETLTEDQKEDIFYFILFLLFKRKIRFIENDYFGGNHYIMVKDLLK